MEGNSDNLSPQEPNSSTDQKVEVSKDTTTSEPTIEKLPTDTTIGSKITFNNTVESNPDEFGVFYMWKIAGKYNLDPKRDYEKIKQMSLDPSITNAFDKEIKQDALRSYTVTEITSAGKKPPEVKKTYDKDFFQRFNYLPNSGIAEVTDEELKDVDKIYIGTGVNTPAFKNIDTLGIYGDENLNPTYFSTSYKVAMSHMPDEINGVKPALIEISLSKLRLYRKILRDPESLYIKGESGKTFITFYGIPAEAIERILVLTKNGLQN
ncbi:MAG: hypothetical protein AAB662_03360 [Patescibacteria group bacterium]